jgi:small subunit ribosomal protein S9
MTQLTTTGITVSEDMTETTTDTPDLETPVDEADAADISEFTSETAPTRFSHIEPAAATGRRKRAIARVRIVPGTGTWAINGRTLDEYFPNKVHQQLVSSPFVELQIDGKYDIVARITGGGASGQAGALRL